MCFVKVGKKDIIILEIYAFVFTEFLEKKLFGVPCIEGSNLYLNI